MPVSDSVAAIDSRISAVVRRYWGFDSLRPLQAEAIQAGIDGRDSLVVAPTGGGKSLCYQVPPAVSERTDVVISPLIALMKDQVDGLRTSGYPAEALNTNMSRDELRQAEQRIAAGEARLVFIAPERVLNPYTVGLLQRVGVRAFAIDESHCISHWGHDFRQHYRRLSELRDYFPDASVHAFTATATERVRRDIVSQLRLRDPLVLVGSFDRPNLVYRVTQRDNGEAQVIAILRRHANKAAIIYCISRKETESLAATLHRNGVRVAHYHAGMSPEQRRRTQELFSSERLDVIVATVAFGMGIDRSDVRCVIHYGVPKSVEHYQQEAGRAGRDGLEAECVLLYSVGDTFKWESLIHRGAEEAEDPRAVSEAALKHLAEMRGYCESHRCRHAALVEYFGQKYDKPNCGACDFCLDEAGERVEGTVTAQKILSCVARCEERFGAGHIVEVLRGARSERVLRNGHDRLSTHGLLRDLDEPTVRGLVYQLIGQNLLSRSSGDYPTLLLNEASWRVMRGKQQVFFTKATREVKSSRHSADDWEGVDRGLFESLRELRRETATERGVPPFVVFSDATLRDLARRRPTRVEDLLKVSGIGARKQADFGDSFVKRIADYCAERRLETDIEKGGSAQSDIADVAPRPVVSGSSRNRAFEMFAEGASIEDVMQAVQRARSTTLGYLAEFIEQTQPETIEMWIPPLTYNRIAEAMNELGDTPMRPVFEKLDGQVPYELIRLVFAHAGVKRPPA